MSQRAFTAVTALLVLGWGTSLRAGSYIVKPVRIELSARQLSTTIQITNLADETTTIQAHVVAWKANGLEEVLTDNDEILLNPPIFTLAKGQQQFMRLGLRRPRADAVESTFRLILEEVPPAPKSGFMGVNTLLKISVPIFYKPKVSSPQLLWKVERASEQEIRLSVQNRGNTHVQIKSLAVTGLHRPEPDFTKDTNAYVLQNGRKEWLIHSERLSTSDQLAVEALTDIGNIRESLVPEHP